MAAVQPALRGMVDIQQYRIKTGAGHLRIKAVTAHQGNDFEVSDVFWDTVNATTGRFYQPGAFVTFPGYEWSGNTPLGGDRNVSAGIHAIDTALLVIGSRPLKACGVVQRSRMSRPCVPPALPIAFPLLSTMR